MAARIRVRAIKSDEKSFVIDDQVTPRDVLFRVQGLTKATISKHFSRDVQQLYEDGDEAGDYCCIDESVLCSLDDGTMIYAQLAEEQAFPEPDKQQHSSTWNEQDLLAAHLCAAIYEDDPVSQINQRPELQCIDSVNVSCKGDVKFMIADKGPERFVAIRGSVSTQDWKQNFKFVPSVPMCGGFLHKGFAQYSEFFPKDAISSWVQDEKQVIVAGHSMGGALASIVALRGLLSLSLSPALAKKEALRAVTFGAPFYATSEVCKFIDSKDWKKYFHNYVVENDPVPRLLNVHPQHALLAALVSALSARKLEARKLEPFIQMASEFVKVEATAPEYSPLGVFTLLSREGDSEYKFVDHQLMHDDVTKTLGKPALSGEWGMTGVQQHCMNSSYFQYLSEVRATKSPRKTVQKTKEECRKLVGANSSMLMKLSVGHIYEYKMEDRYVLVSIKSVNGDGTYSGICLESPHEELPSIVPTNTQKAQIAPCTLNVLMSKSTVDGTTIPTDVHITSEVTEARHTETSLLWVCDLEIEGLEFQTKTLRITLQDSAGRLRFHFHGVFTVQSAQAWHVRRQPLEVNVFHMFHEQPFKFTTESSYYKLHEEKPSGALSPLENKLDIQSPIMMHDAFHRLLLEAFLGEAAASPQRSRLEKLQSIKLFQYLVTLEMLSSGTRNIERFMTEKLVEFPSQRPDDCIAAMQKILNEDVRDLAMVFEKIANFVFKPHSISFKRETRQKIFTAVGALAVGCGLIVLTGAAVPAIYYGGFAAASAGLEFGMGAACACGAAGVGAGGFGLWLGTPTELANEDYKRVLISFVEQLGGHSAGVLPMCLTLEEKIEQLVLASEVMKNDEINKKLFLERKFSTDRRARNFLSSHSMGGIWKRFQDTPSLSDATSKSKELAARHIFTTQLVRSIRLELLDTSYVAVIGMQNAGKSTFIKSVWPDCHVEGLGGGSNHTLVAKPFRINDEVVVVDFPGINDWSDVGWMSRMFMGMATFAVVVLKCEDVELHGRQFLAEVRDYFSPEQILVFITHADRFPDMIPDSRSVKELRLTYASKERLNFNHEQIFLTAMLAVDDEGHPSEEKLMRCVAKGINGPREVHDQLQVALSKLLRRPVSLDAAS